ncbi:hypothetical protein B0H14DRAFT_2358343 [Mycena olivaceomarginata]|nr:hypothetical protein B0H14DRAFT_2358343 [Mycena olivaceomarginata]
MSDALEHQAEDSAYTKDNRTIDSRDVIDALAAAVKAIDAWTTSKRLVPGLTALEKLHPFISEAVVSFTLVTTLADTHRETDKKVLAVLKEMQDMMAVLFHLRDIRDTELMGSTTDATMLKTRLLDLLPAIARDITECGNLCDVYMKKSLLVKVVKSKLYGERLAGYATLFRRYKEELTLAFTLHTSHAALAIATQTNRIETIFKSLETPNKHKITEYLAEHEGEKECFDNDAVLQELVTVTGESLASFDPTHSGNGDLATANLKKLLAQELEEGVEDASQKNMRLFDRKLNLQSKQLSEAAQQDLMSALADRTPTSDLQDIWKQGDWKERVDARTFVITMQSYYHEKFNASDTAAPDPSSSVPPLREAEDDRWTLKHIRAALNVQQLIDAIDTDDNGLVSIKEVNDFVRRRPESWSLPMWVAFCAAGWHISVTWYKNQIYHILAAMMNLNEHVKPPNLQAVDRYLAGPEMQRVELLLRSTNSAKGLACKDLRLRDITNQFQDTEVAKFQTGLQELQYELDDVATIPLITGTQQAERYIYPLLYQLLKRHFDILRLACVHILDESEFNMIRTSLAVIFKAVDQWTKDLEAIFKSQSLNVRDRLGQFAFGMFQLAYGDHQRNPINNTIRTFKEEPDFKHSDSESLGPSPEDDEQTAEAVFARIDTGILQYGIKDEPSNVVEFELKNRVA